MFYKTWKQYRACGISCDGRRVQSPPKPACNPTAAYRKELKKMELRELLVKVELHTRKAGWFFEHEGHGTCREQLLEVHELLHAELPQLMDPPTDEEGVKK